MNVQTTPRLLIVGGPSSGKTTYRAQVYQRVEHQDGELRLFKSVEDMAPLEGDVERLVRGLQPNHTNSDVFHTATLTVENRKNQVMQLEFADYGGEQIAKVTESNFVPIDWVDRAQKSSRWLFFLRIDQIRSTKSFMSDPVHTEPPPKTNDGSELPERSDEISAIETLQRLLFVRGTSIQYPLDSPRLGILLSCWDELPNPENEQAPETLLEQRAPLLYRFVMSNWQSSQLKIWGLSSTEQKLPMTKPDIAFAKKGAEHVGYIILSHQKKSKDLTIPISWLME